MTREPQQDQADEFEGTDRFEVLGRLGMGGMGVVYRVFDRENDVPMALKCMKQLSGTALVRFKNEFRALQSIHHPNIVRLGELLQVDNRWFFTMEFVEGQDFLCYVRQGASTGRQTATLVTDNTFPHVGPSLHKKEAPCHPLDTAGTNAGNATTTDRPRMGTSFDEARLRDGLVQLTHGVRKIHAEGLVHRDIKSSNVLINNDGRLVLLDFGLITQMESPLWQDHHLVGTIGYMAPEQAAGTDLGPEADWYSVGVLLYWALTGYAPLGPGGVPPRPRELEDSVPADLDALCMQLLYRDANERADGTTILKVLGISDPSPPVVQATISKSAIFVGRHRELATLQAAWEDSRKCPLSVFLSGESGVGKTALIGQFVHELRHSHPETLVLQSRCYERESSPYKGIDGIVDALSQYLSQLHPDQVTPLLPADLSFLTTLFPALGRILPPDRPNPEEPPSLSQQEQRWRAFGALRMLLTKVCNTRPLVLVIDDMQWANADSWSLAAELLRGPHALKCYSSSFNDICWRRKQATPSCPPPYRAKFGKWK